MEDLNGAIPAAEPEFKGKDIEACKRMFARAEEACIEARKLAHRDRDWHDNFNDSQWSDDEKKVLDLRRQPIVTSNRIKRKVGFICGMEQRQRSDPKAFPRNPEDTDSADIVTQVLDFIETETRFDNIASQAFRDMAIEGIEACEVIVKNGDQIEVNQLQYDGFFYDPRSKKRDFSDARYLGYQDWFDEGDVFDMFRVRASDPEEQKRQDQGLRTILESAYEDGTQDEGYEDKPFSHWGDMDRKRIRVACMYYKGEGGVWNYVYFTGGGILKEGVSPYLDDQGKPDCAIIAASCYITRKNERFGIVREMISPQSEMNYRRSMALFLIKQKRMWQRAKGILPNDASETVARADGILTANGIKDQEWGFLDSSQEIAENFNLLQEAKSEIDVQGPNAGLQGRGTEDQSGRAIIAQQQAGMAEENDIFDTHNDWKARVYRAKWCRAKQFWTEPKYIRITDDENAFKFIHLNQMQPVVDPMTGQPQMDPETGQPAMQAVPGTELAKMDADIILQPAPDSITLQHEEFVQLTDMAKSGVPIPPDVLLEASQIRDKTKLAKRMKEEMGSQAKLQQAGQQIEQLTQMLDQMKQQLQKAQEAPIQKPPTPLEMIKAQTEQVKQGHISAQTEHTRAQTMQLAREAMTPEAGPEPLTGLDLVDMELKRAQTAKTYADVGVSQAQAYKTVKEADRPPPPPPKPFGNGAGKR